MTEFMLDLKIPELKVPDPSLPLKKHYPDVYWTLTNSYITEKVDGIKITLFRNDKPFSTDYRDNWIVAYKNKILYPYEFDASDLKYDFSFRQYSHIFEHLKQHHNDSIPPNTEFFTEFSMNKPTTLSHKFKKLLFNIRIAKSRGEVVGGYLQTFQESILPLHLGDKIGLARPYHVRLTLHEDITFEQIKFQVEKLPSKIASFAEGVVLEHGDLLFKISNLLQHDKTYRRTVKDKFRNPDPMIELAYWDGVYEYAAKAIGTGTTMQDKLEHAKLFVNSLSDTDSIFTCRDGMRWVTEDNIYIKAREMVLKSLPENKNGLFLGRFQPLSKAHAGIIEEASKKHHKLFVAIVDAKKLNKDNPFSYEYRKSLIDSLGIPNVVVIPAKTGNIRALLNKIPCGIETVYAGSDRLFSYSEQLKGFDVECVEIPRTTVSATSIRQTLVENNKEQFEQLTVNKLHSKFEEMKNLYEQI